MKLRTPSEVLIMPLINEIYTILFTNSKTSVKEEQYWREILYCTSYKFHFAIYYSMQYKLALQRQSNYLPSWNRQGKATILLYRIWLERYLYDLSDSIADVKVTNQLLFTLTAFREKLKHRKPSRSSDGTTWYTIQCQNLKTLNLQAQRKPLRFYLIFQGDGSLKEVVHLRHGELQALLWILRDCSSIPILIGMCCRFHEVAQSVGKIPVPHDIDGSLLFKVVLDPQLIPENGVFQELELFISNFRVTISHYTSQQP